MPMMYFSTPTTIKPETDCHVPVLQEDLDVFAHWTHIWQMEFNPKKCEFLGITNKKNPIVGLQLLH